MSRYSLSDYTQALMNLLPRGIAWNRQPDSVQYRALRGLAGSYQRSDADACALIAGAFPATADAMLDEWYDSLGMRDDCGTSAFAADVEQARKFILAKLLSTGGQSREYFTALAATMGFVVSILEYRVPLCGFSFCGVTLNSRENCFTWMVAVQPPGDNVTTSTAYLECLFRRYAPAHTQVVFEYLSSYRASLSIAWDNGSRSLAGTLTADDGVVVSGVPVTAIIRTMSGQRYVATVTTDSAGGWSFAPEADDFSAGYYTVYAQASVDMPDDVTVQVRSGLLTAHVYNAVTGVSLSADSLILPPGESATVTVTVSPANADDNRFTVGVSGNVTAVDNGDGTLTVTATGSGEGSIDVTTTDGGYSASLSVSVIRPASFTVNVSDLSLPLFRCDNVSLLAVDTGSGFSETGFSVDENGMVTPDGLFTEAGEYTLRVATEGGIFFYSNGVAFSPVTAVTAMPEYQTSFDSAFRECTELASVGADTFTYCTGATSFASAFYGCTGLTSLPDGLFSGLSGVTSFQGCFEQCSNLEVIGEGMFTGCTTARNCAFLFNQCSSLVSVPEGLLADYAGGGQLNFGYGLSACSSLKTVGSHLIPANCDVDLNYAFRYSVALAVDLNTIFPEDSYAVTELTEIFNGCTALSGSGVEFIAKMSMATSHSGALKDCTSLDDYQTLQIDYADWVQV